MYRKCLTFLATTFIEVFLIKCMRKQHLSKLQRYSTFAEIDFNASAAEDSKQKTMMSSSVSHPESTDHRVEFQ